MTLSRSCSPHIFFEPPPLYREIENLKASSTHKRKGSKKILFLSKVKYIRFIGGRSLIFFFDYPSFDNHFARGAVPSITP